jgi:hypothetical protein
LRFPNPPWCLDAGGEHFNDTLSTSPDFPLAGRFLDTFDLWWTSQRNKNQAAADSAASAGSAFCRGLVAYPGYELCAEIEPSLIPRLKNAPNILC